MLLIANRIVAYVNPASTFSTRYTTIPGLYLAHRKLLLHRQPGAVFDILATYRCERRGAGAGFVCPELRMRDVHALSTGMRRTRSDGTAAFATLALEPHPCWRPRHLHDVNISFRQQLVYQAQYVCHSITPIKIWELQWCVGSTLHQTWEKHFILTEPVSSFRNYIWCVQIDMKGHTRAVSMTPVMH